MFSPKCTLFDTVSSFVQSFFFYLCSETCLRCCVERQRHNWVESIAPHLFVCCCCWQNTKHLFPQYMHSIFRNLYLSHMFWTHDGTVASCLQSLNLHECTERSSTCLPFPRCPTTPNRRIIWTSSHHCQNSQYYLSFHRLLTTYLTKEKKRRNKKVQPQKSIYWLILA